MTAQGRPISSMLVRPDHELPLSLPSGRAPHSSPSRYACVTESFARALAIGRYLRVQSRPARVRSRTSPASRRACIRYPSCLISCSHSVPLGAACTSCESCGFTKVGKDERRAGRGGLSAATRRRLSGQEPAPVRRRRALSPGTVLVREWHSVGHQVTIIEKGVLFRGERYRSMSEVARLITGARWSGPRFFGVKA